MRGPRRLRFSRAFADISLDYFVAGCGTGGTVAGVSRAIRTARPSTRIVVCEPDNSPVLRGGCFQPRDGNGAPSGSHPSFRPHPMQGWTPDFVPKITERAAAGGFIDKIVPVNGRDAMQASRDLARKEGIFTGITGGATVAGALTLARNVPPGSNILCVLPDTGERYQSTPLFAEVATDMTEEELEISRSTRMRDSMLRRPRRRRRASRAPPTLRCCSTMRRGISSSKP